MSYPDENARPPAPRSHSSAERVVLPDACALVDYMAIQMHLVLDGLEVMPDRRPYGAGGNRCPVENQNLPRGYCLLFHDRLNLGCRRWAHR